MNGEQAQAGWRWAILSLAIALALLGLMYRDNAVFLARLWTDWSEGGYSHGFIALLLALFIVYSNRRTLSRIDACPSAYALPAIALCALVWTLAGLAGIRILQVVSLLPMILSVVWALSGFRVAQNLLLPCLLVGLAIPVWFPLQLPLQEITATGAYWLARSIGIPALLDGFVIRLPAGTLLIEEACSGLHYLLAAVTLGIFHAWMNVRSWRRRLLVVAIATAAGILANVLRVFIIIWIAHRAGMQHPMVEDHLALGWYLFGAFVILLLLLDIWAGPEQPGMDAVPAVHTAACDSGVRTRISILLVTLALIVAGPLVYQAVRGSLDSRPVHTLALPDGHGNWRGPLATGDTWRPEYRGSVAGTAAYTRAGETVYLFAGYYPEQHQDAELINEVNRIADGERWETVNHGGVRNLPNGRSVIEAELDSLYDTRRIVWYYYWVAGRFTTSATRAKLYQLAGMFAGRPDAAVIAMSTPVRGDGAAARERLEDFIKVMEQPLLLNITGTPEG